MKLWLMAAPSVVARYNIKKTDTGCIVGKETIPVIKYVNQCTMHICGMDFSSLASYWQIKALLMLEPSVVTPQNQYFPANSERMSVHCLESGCIGKYTHLGPRDFPRVGILHPSALEIALGLCPRAISQASGCKIPALGKSLWPRGVYFPIHPSSRQCTDTMHCCTIWVVSWEICTLQKSSWAIN